MRKQERQTVRKRRGGGIELLGLVVGGLLILGSLVYLGYLLIQYQKGRAEYRALEEKVFLVADPREEQSVQGDAAEQEGWTSDPHVQQALVELAEENADIVGWIVFDSVDISYPVMLGQDDAYYLNHTFSGEVNSAGSIFMEVGNKGDFQDVHTILYGHNMRDLSMFGRLKYYKERSFYEGHEYFTIYTPDAVFRYQIFACYDVPEDSEVYTVGFDADDAFGTFLRKMNGRAYYATGVNVSEQDKVITLSTCSSEGVRFVVHAKRIEEYWG